MPPPSTTAHLPKSPNRVLAEAEAQWLFTDEEIANTPSVQDGMSVEEERDRRIKGINFVLQVGIMLKLPQLTLSTACCFFQRFLMRASLVKERNGIPKLHHFQAAATALFLATKVEESCRKIKELVLAFCRVAQKNPNLIVDEQSKDFWRWRDCILYNEDHMLEVLCFDLTVESPHRQLFEMLKFYKVEHNKPLRNSAWAFVTDSNNTELCLLVSSRTIAVASLYAACKFCNVSLPDDSKGRPWWESHQVRLKEIRGAVEHMLSNYDGTANKVNGLTASGASDGNGSIYAGLLTPGMDGANDSWDKTRMPKSRSTSPFPPPPDSERRLSNASSVGMKRGREEERPTTNGDQLNGEAQEEKENKRLRLEEESAEASAKHHQPEAHGPTSAAPVTAAPAAANESLNPIVREEAERVRNGNQQAEKDAEIQQAPSTEPDPGSGRKMSEGEVSEEGELEE